MFRSSSQRTPAERRMDELGAEARRLGALRFPSMEQRERLRQVREVELPKARRAVDRVRRQLEGNRG